MVQFALLKSREVLEMCFQNSNTFSVKDQNRLWNALLDGTFKWFPNSCSSTKKVALVRASKQHYVGMIVGKKGDLLSGTL